MSLLHLGQSNFEQEVLNSESKVLVDFWAPWCAPCRMLSPVIEELAEELTSIKVGKVNVDEEGELAQRYNIYSIPTIIIFESGKPIKQISGFVPKQRLLDLL